MCGSVHCEHRWSFQWILVNAISATVGFCVAHLGSFTGVVTVDMREDLAVGV